MQEKLTTYTISSQTAFVELPNDFIEIISLYYDNTEISRIPMSRFRALNKNTYAGTPQSFTRQQEKLYLYPQPSSGEVILYYYGEFPALSSDTAENALTKVAPDLIIYSALTYAADYYLDERAVQFEQKYQGFMLELQEQANDQEVQWRYSGNSTECQIHRLGGIMSKTSFFKQSGTNNVGTSGNDATDPTEIADSASDSSFFKQNGVNSEQ